MRLILFVAITAITAAPAAAQTEDYEQWNRQRILSALSDLQLSAELECEATGVSSSAWAGLQEEIAELHDGPFSPYDGIVFPKFHYVQIEHIVARNEADESGLCARGEEARKEFATDLLNLTLAPGSLNTSKGDKDAHDLETAGESLFRDNLTPHGLCWWAAQTIRVKAKYRLSVDTGERSALGSVLQNCTEDQVYRPRLPAGADWVFRDQFLEALSGEHAIESCSVPVADVSALPLAASAASPHLPSMACVPPVMSENEDGEGGSDPGTATAPPSSNPRAEQIAAQNACIQTLESKELSKTCTNVRSNCPNVDPILRGEPLYEFLRDTDNDGVVCESL